MSIKMIDLDKKEKLENGIEDLKRKIASYPVPNIPAKLTAALEEKEAELNALMNEQFDIN